VTLFLKIFKVAEEVSGYLMVVFRVLRMIWL